MKKQIPGLLILILMAVGNVMAQTSGDLHKIFIQRGGEVYFSFDVEDNNQLNHLTKMISIDQLNNKQVRAYANEKEFSRFIELNIPYTILDAPSSLTNDLNMCSIAKAKDITAWDFYPTYEAYENLMEQFATNYPQLCKLETFGTLPSGRKLLSLKISDNVNQEEDEPEFFYTSTMHGDETTGYVTMLHLIDYLLSNYNSDERITNLVNSMEIYINPLANPDGTYSGGNSSVQGATRTNANNVDFNRNFPDPVGGPHPDGNAWQPETVAFMAFAEQHNFVMSANLHGGVEVVNYPWDTWSKLHADNDWWYNVSKAYADTAQFNSPSGYFTYLGGVTNGYQWYSVEGGRQDYMNYFQQCREFTLEISSTKLVPASQLEAHWNYNYRSLLNYLEEALKGVRGIVLDEATDLPIKAMVTITDHDKDSSMVFTAMPKGNYHRPIMPGTYDITYSALGYSSYTEHNVVVGNNDATVVNVKLTPGNLIPDFHAVPTVVALGNSVQFTDDTYGDVQTWQWDFEGGSPASSTDKNPQVTYSTAGTYNVSLTVNDGSETKTITKENYIVANEEYIMHNGIITTCSGLFMDSGADNNYDNNEDFEMTIQPGSASSMIKVVFQEFDVESASGCTYDWLKIYEGTGTTGSLIGTYCGSDNPGTIVADNNQGSLTFVFHSDYGTTAGGWKALISCVGGSGNTPVANFSANKTTIIPNESIQFSDESQNIPTTWLWSFEGGEPATSSDENPIVKYTYYGTFNVTLTVTNNDGSDSKTIVDYITVQNTYNLTEENKQCVLYPNPTSGDFVNLKTAFPHFEYTIMNQLGEFVQQGNSTTCNYRLSLIGLPRGMYYVRLINENNQFIRKIILK